MTTNSDRKRGEIGYEIAIFAACFLLIWQMCAVLKVCQILSAFGVTFAIPQLAHIVPAAILMGIILLVRFWQKNRQLESALATAQTQEDALVNELCFDKLTGLPNRRFVEQNLQQIAGGSATSVPSRCDFLAIELNHFAGLKQARGSKFTDKVLRIFSTRLQNVTGVRFVSTLAENRFLIAGEPKSSSDSDALIDKVQTLLRNPIVVDADVVHLEWLMGVAKYPHDSADIRSCASYAELALTYADENNDQRISHFCLKVAEQSQLRANLERELKQAVEASELSLDFQPYYDMSTGEIAGFEALARWTLADGKIVPPSEFVPLAEEIGLMAPMTFDLFAKALEQLNRWPDSQSLAFNICATLLEDNCAVDRLVSIMHRAKVDFRRVEFEITESRLMDDCETAIKNIKRLRAAGVRFALDDMGTGYSTFLRLAYVEIDKVKIDRAFTKRMLSDVRTAKVVSGMISMARELDAEIVVEGVETEEQLKRVLGLRCQFVQGFLLAKPRDAEATYLASSLAPIDISAPKTQLAV